MCAPSAPSMPELPPTPAPAPVNQPLIKDPVMPTPPPENVAASKEETKIKKRKSKRELLQQSGSGASALRIPLNTGGKAKTGSLNIPK